jgi:hypothetical protein
MKRLVEWIKNIWYSIKMRRKIKELRKKDPFIYK